MVFMDIMGLDEQSQLFESGKSIRATSSDSQLVYDGKDGQNFSDLNKRGLAIEKGYEYKDGRALSNDFHRSRGNVCNVNSESIQTVQRFESTNIFNLGENLSKEELPDFAGYQLKDLGIKDKVCNFGSRSGDKYISVFIGNLPPFANNRWIFDNFIKLGKVADYYVSGRLSKFSKKPFGFVRFHSLEDANKAVNHFNGAWVDGYKLEVELARFPRRLLEDEVGRNVNISRENQRFVSKGTNDGIVFADTRKAWLDPNKSFAQVLLGNTDVKMSDVGNVSASKIKVRAEVKECGWLNVSVVAKIKWGESIGKIRKELISNVKGLESVSRLGIRKIILSFVSLEDRNNAIIHGDWMGLVEDVREWRGELVCTDKLWNMSCIGIPITAWNIESFRSIAEIWGSMVFIDDNTLKGEDFLVAKFVIEAETEITNTVIDLLVGNEVFQIKVAGSRLETKVENMDEDVKLMRNNEKEVSVMDTVPQVLPILPNSSVAIVNSEGSAINAEWPVGRMDDLADGVQDTERNGEFFVIERKCDVLDNRSDVQIQDISGAYIENIVEGPAGCLTINSDCVQNFDCTVQRAGYEPISDVSMQLMDPNTDVLVSNYDVQIQPYHEDVVVSADGEGSIICAGSLNLQHGSLEDTSKSVLNKNNAACNLSENVSFEFNVLDVSCIHKGPSMDVEQNLIDGRDDVNIHCDAPPIKSSEILHELEQIQEVTTATNGSRGKIEKEVLAMMNLGNSLDLFNVAQFEDAVRQATMDEVDDDSSSIGHRVKSKRKYTGKSKVKFGHK